MEEIIKFVHDDDLEKMLTNLGLMQQLEEGRIKCKFCKEFVVVDEIYALFPESGSIKLVCNKIDCIRNLNQFLNTHKLLG